MSGAVGSGAPALRNVPDRLRDACDVSAGSGEVFWFGDRAEEAARWLAGSGCAIVGGEVYRRHPVAWATYLCAWALDPDRRARESWQAFVRRGLNQTLVAIDAAPSDRRELRYFFAVAAPPR